MLRIDQQNGELRGAGGSHHVRDDIPVLVDALRKGYPNAVISLGPAAGENAGVIDALATFSLGELNPRK